MIPVRPEPNDREVIARVLDGDTNAFSVLVARYQERVLRLGYAFFKNADEAEDFTQDVFLKAYAGLAGFRGISAFSTWLTRIAYNAGINAKRRNGRFEPLEAEPADLRTLSPEEQSLHADSVRVLGEAMKKLPEKYSLCLDLFFYHGMKYQEISEVTGFPVNTVKSHVFRAKQDLRAALDLKGGFHDM